MKRRLTGPQRKALEHCAEYAPHWTGVLTQLETVIASLRRRGLIERGPMTMHAGQTYRITAAGRAALAAGSGEGEKR